jgi:hypothetical protein
MNMPRRHEYAKEVKMTQKVNTTGIKVNTRPYRKKLTTPTGKARFPALQQPDTAFTSEGEYHVGLVVDPDTAEQLTSTVEKLLEGYYNEVFNQLNQKQAKKLYKYLPWEEEYDENDEPTGNIIVKFRSKTMVTKEDGSQFSLQPAIFDKKKRPWPEDKLIYGGSIIKVSTTTTPYYIPSTGMCGIKLRLNAVQVIEHRDARSAEAFGFDDESDDEEEEKFDTTPPLETKEENNPIGNDNDNDDDDDEEEDDDINF